MANEFDFSEAKKNLSEMSKSKSDHLEKERLQVLEQTLVVLKDFFKESPPEVILVGSLIVPGAFNSSSDIDIVLKNFHGDRFEVWPLLERKLGRDIEIIIYEKCSFRDHIDQFGLKVL